MSVVDEKYKDIIGGSVVVTAGIAVPGLFVPVLDMAGVGATWTVMVASIAERSGQEISPATVGKLVAAAVVQYRAMCSDRKFSPGLRSL